MVSFSAGQFKSKVARRVTDAWMTAADGPQAVRVTTATSQTKIPLRFDMDEPDSTPGRLTHRIGRS